MLGVMEMRTITLEEHYATPEFMSGPGRQITQQAEAAKAHPDVAAGLARLIDQLCDIGDGRIANMDAARIDVQVLSLTAPGLEQLAQTMRCHSPGARRHACCERSAAIRAP